MNKTTETSFCSRPAALFACGRQSIRLPVPVYIRSSASVVGSREKQGPLGELFDFAGEDDLFGCDNWEDAESSLQRDALHLALQKAGLHSTDIRYLFAGDLLGQSIATSFGLMQYERPLFGLYGACSTCGLSLTLASLAVSGSFADFAACVTSSHFASAEKEFRFPLGYGNQRPLSASWTVTGSGAFILANAPSGHDRAMITGLTPGKIVDYGLRDSMNMGACMAPAAADTIRQHFEDFGTAPKDYDKIVTGDLGKVGQRVLLDLLQTSGIDLGERHMDCGIEIYDCKKQDTHGCCKDKRCLFPSACSNIEADHTDYLNLLRELRRIEGIKKVFVRSGLRYDYMMADKNDAFFRELVEHHISGQLKVAPEHMSDNALYYMGKPSFNVYEQFRERYARINQKLGRKQYLVPYLMSSHPGATLDDAIMLAQYLNRIGYMPEQVQDFYPTPSTMSTCMYYTGVDPRTMQPIYVARDPHEKAMQRALIQYRKPENYKLVREALEKAGHRDLIGYTKHCLIRPVPPRPGETSASGGHGTGKKGGKAHGSAGGAGKGPKGSKGHGGMSRAQNTAGRNRAAQGRQGANGGGRRN